MTDRADLVVIGAGTIGGWASVFARPRRPRRVVVLERGLVGMGASSRAAGIVRAQGGTPPTVALGRWTIDFYRGQQAAYGTDSGFRELGYLILAVTDEDERAGRERVAMQQAEGLDVRWVDAAEAAGQTGGTLVAERSSRRELPRRATAHIDPPRNVRAYSLAMQAAGVELRERTPFTGLRTEPTADGGPRHRGRDGRAATIETERVLLTGGPSLRAVGGLAGVRIPAGAVRHTVAVTRAARGIRRQRSRWSSTSARGCTGGSRRAGCCSGWSNPDGPAGRGTRDRLAVLRADARAAGRVRARSRGTSAMRRIWAATIDYTPDHLPILGPATGRRRGGRSRA